MHTIGGMGLLLVALVPSGLTEVTRPRTTTEVTTSADSLTWGNVGGSGSATGWAYLEATASAYWLGVWSEGDGYWRVSSANLASGDVAAIEDAFEAGDEVVLTWDSNGDVTTVVVQ